MANGHAYPQVLDYTLEEIQTFVEVATRRIGRELVSSTQGMALGVGVGMSGDTKPLNEWTRQVTGDISSSSSSLPQGLKGVLQKLAVDQKEARKERDADGDRSSSASSKARSARRRALEGTRPRPRED